MTQDMTFADAVKSRARHRENLKQTETTFGLAMQENREQYAERLNISRDTGLPTDVLGDDFTELRDLNRIKQLDFGGMSKRSPETYNFVKDYDNAAVVQDDITLLEAIEDTFAANLVKGVADRGTDLVGSLYSFASQAGDALESRLPMGGFVFDENFIPRYVPPTKFKELKDAGMTDLVAETGDILKAFDAGYQPDATWEEVKEEFSKGDIGDGISALLSFGVEQGVVSTPDMAATVFALPTYVLARSQEIGDERAENKGKVKSTLEDTVEAAPFAIASSLLERILPKRIFDNLSKAQIDEFGEGLIRTTADRLKDSVKNIGSGILIEGGTEFIQEGLIEYTGERFGTDAAMKLGEALDRGLAGAAGGGVAGGILSGIESAAVNTIDYLDSRNREVEAKAQNEQEFIDKLNEQSSEADLRRLDPERFKQFIENNDGDKNTQIYIDGAQLQLYLNSLTQSDPAVEILQKRANEAATLGSDVTIPVADFATHIAGTEHFDNLRDFMTLSSETVAPFRREEALQEAQQYMDQLITDAQENVSEYAEAQEIFDSVRQQLLDAGVYTPQNINIMAQIVPAWATVYARDNDITVAEAYEQSNLRIDGPQTGKLKELLDEKATLRQRVTDGVKNVVNKVTGKKVQESKKPDYSLYDFDNVFTHSGTVIENIKNQKPFDGIFASYGDTSYSGVGSENTQTSFVARKGKIARRGDIDLDYDESINFLKSEFPNEADEFYNELYEWVAEDKVDPWENNILDRFGYDPGEASWEAQRLRGQMAAAQDYDAIEMIDESGVSIMIPHQSKVLKLENSNNETLRQSIDDKKARGYYEPNNSIIRLTEASNLSTFLHEFAHFAYEMEMKSAKTDKVNQINDWFKRNAKNVTKEAISLSEEKSITPDDLNSFLDDGTTGVEAKDAALREATHEQFARGFEAYLMEGKAPSVELRNIFAAFARWLSQIYRNIADSLRVNLDAEMTQVFDRMLATEEQLDHARARQQYEPMFTDAAMAGMTEEEFASYKEQQQKTKVKESQTLRDKLIGQITRQTKSWWKREKGDLVDEQLVTLRNEPTYRAIEGLKGEEIKLDRATVKELYGEEFTDKLGKTRLRIPPKLKNMTAPGGEGVHPDEAAAFFGFNSGDEMVKSIIESPTIKQAAEAKAQEIMVERHGDILNDGTIEQQADEALQNEERGELLLKELRALAKRRNTPVLDRKAIKELAEENIAKLSFKQIHPQKYRKAEVRAAQESARMLAEGNVEGALQAKSRQVMNYYLGMAATNAKNETIKIVDRMARYKKKTVREAIIKAGEDYWQQLTKILERFEFRKSASLKKVDEVNESINIWMDRKINEEGDGLILSPAVLNESYITHWKNVAFGDLKGIDDSVKNIEHVARYANKLTRMGEEIEYQKLVNRWVDKMNEQKDRFKRVASEADKPNMAAKFGRWSMALMTKIPWMASWLDGGERAGLSHQILVQPMTDAYDAELKLWKKAASPVMQAIEQRSKKTRKRHNKKYFIPEIEGTNGHTGNLLGHEILAVALNTGNKGNLRKLLLGEGWANIEDESSISINNPKLQAVLKHMTKEDWDMVQLIWDQMDTLYPKLKETHQRTTGLVPPKVEATSVETPFGSYRGGYYPVKYDSMRDHQAMMHEDKRNAEVESMFNTIGSIQASVNTGTTNERTRYYGPIRLSLDVVSNHFQEVIHYVTHHDAVREVNRLINDRSVADTIKAKLGHNEYAQLKPWLNDIAKDGKEALTKMPWDPLLRRLRFGITLGVMGFKASTGIIQLLGLSNTVAEVGVGPMMQSVRQILGSPSKMKSSWEFASEHSKVLNHRTQTMDREIKNAMKKLEDKRGLLAGMQELSMKHIAIIQTYSVDLPSWYAAYIKGVKEHGDEKRAYQYADWVVENIQGSGATKDLPRYMRYQNEAGRMLTMFMTFFSSLWNNQRDVVKGVRQGNYSATTLGAKVSFLMILPVILESLMRDELGAADDETDEEALQRMLTKVALYPTQSIPVARDIVAASTGEYGYNITPLQGILERGIRSSSSVAFTDKELLESKWDAKNISTLAGATAGIPGTAQVWATGEHIYDVLVEGEDLTMRELLFGPKRD